MTISIGIVGKPNAGKSTFFSALTLIDVKIAPFPFTTIEPNKGTGYIKRECPHKILGKECEPRDSSCVNGIRFIPIEITDVAGLVPDAHLGKGLGLQFLDDIRQVDGFIHVIDGSGKSDLEGNPCERADPSKEIEFLEKEIVHWIYGIIEKNWGKNKGKPLFALSDVFSSLKISLDDAENIAKKLGLNEMLKWNETQKLEFANEIRKLKPMLIAVNKTDCADSELLMKLEEKYKERVIFCSALYELILRKAAKNNIIEYVAGEKEFKIINANEEQRKILEKIKEYLKTNKSTGVQCALEKLVKETLGLIAVYPVEDENKWCNKKGAVLPNVFLLPKNSSPLKLAGKIHSDFAKNFICAIDGKKKMRIGKEHVLKDGDVIKIVSG